MAQKELVLFQLDLFGAPPTPVPLAAMPPDLPEPPRPSAEPLPGQMALGDSARLRSMPCRAALGDGELERAAALGQQLRVEPGLQTLLDELAAGATAATADELGLALLADPAAVERLGRFEPFALRRTAEQGLRLHLARRLSAEGPSARALGALAGDHLLAAGRWKEATVWAAATRPLLRGAELAEALLIEGNARFAGRDLPSARVAYFAGLRTAPEAFALDRVADEQVRDLAFDAEELELDPAAPWLPFVGFALGVFLFEELAFERQPSAADQFSLALGLARRARARASFDRAAQAEQTAQRRAMKQLAPLLFKRLMEEELV